MSNKNTTTRLPRRAMRAPFRWTITRTAYNAIRDTVGSLPAESGSMLGGDQKRRRISHVHFDEGRKHTSVLYVPNEAALNAVRREDWSPKGIELCGFVHSHPRGYTRLSQGDRSYATAILDAITSIDELVLPIVQTEPDTGSFMVHPFVATRDGLGLAVDDLVLNVVEDDADETPLRPRIFVPAAHAGIASPVPVAVPSPQQDMLPDVFSRVSGAYNLTRMARSRLVIVGCGGSTGFNEDMVRAGGGEFVLIDPDTISPSNIATQMTYVDDIGKPKVEVIAERLRRINPNVRVLSLQKSLDDIDDAHFKELAFEPLATGTERPLVTLLCNFTDSFYAQARGNRLGLNFAIPTLSAQVYAEGRGAELTFTHPDTTPACNRCILWSRYRAFLEEGYVNTVGSTSAPIFATSRLNASKGWIALAVLHHGTDHPRYGDLLARMGNRNLVQLRLDPDLPMSVFAKVFGTRKRRVFFDEAVWLPQQPKRLRPGQRACPDCGGSGKLWKAKDTFTDTRVMRV